jgi:hypothetical protein
MGKMLEPGNTTESLGRIVLNIPLFVRVSLSGVVNLAIYILKVYPNSHKGEPWDKGEPFDNRYSAGYSNWDSKMAKAKLDHLVCCF